MSQVIQLCGYFTIVFALSIGASYIFASIRQRRKQSNPLPGSSIQLRSGVHVYRSRYLGHNSFGWIISAPLSRDSYVPLRVGEGLTVWMPTDQGLRHFETEIVLRDSETHQMTIRPPKRMHPVERRESARKRVFANPNALLDGQNATLLDLAQGGARMVAAKPLGRGQRTELELPGERKVGAWVLDSSPAMEGYVVRVRFEEEVSLR